MVGLEIKIPLICQAGSAEAFLDSIATGKEQSQFYSFFQLSKDFSLIFFRKFKFVTKQFSQTIVIKQFNEGFN